MTCTKRLRTALFSAILLACLLPLTPISGGVDSAQITITVTRTQVEYETTTTTRTTLRTSTYRSTVMGPITTTKTTRTTATPTVTVTQDLRSATTSYMPWTVTETSVQTSKEQVTHEETKQSESRTTEEQEEQEAGLTTGIVYGEAQPIVEGGSQFNAKILGASLEARPWQGSVEGVVAEVSGETGLAGVPMEFSLAGLTGSGGYSVGWDDTGVDFGVSAIETEGRLDGTKVSLDAAGIGFSFHLGLKKIEIGGTLGIGGTVTLYPEEIAQLAWSTVSNLFGGT